MVDSFEMGIYCETRRLTSYTGDDLALRYLHNKAIIARYFNSLYNNEQCPSVRLYRHGEAQLYVGQVRSNKNGIHSAILKIEGYNVNLYLTVDNGEEYTLVERPVDALKLKGGLIKASTVTQGQGKKVSPAVSSANVVSDNRGNNWIIPEQWLKELNCK